VTGCFIVLGIDQSTKSSGWAIVDVGATLAVRSGVAKKSAEVRSVVEGVVLLARSSELPLVVVLEDHRSFAFSRGNMSVKSLLGMGAARGRWQQELDVAGATDVHMVGPKEWRKAVLGLAGNATAERAKEAAQRYARLTLGKDLGNDESEALCIAMWGVRNVTPKAAKRRGRRKT
jgi:Holliday junction resolvasome RuvABC endonuclease subunit